MRPCGQMNAWRSLISSSKTADDRAYLLRLLEPSFRKVIYARSEGLDWRPLVMTQLKTLGASKTRPGASTPKLKRYAPCIKPSSSSHILWVNNKPSGVGLRVRAELRSSA